VAFNGDVVPRLFANLANQRVLRGLAGLDVTARKFPTAQFAPNREQYAMLGEDDAL
jgi:hypothetical protein